MYRVEVKVRNAKLYNAITSQHRSVNAFCDEHGLSPSEVGNLLNFKVSPMNSLWEWRQVVRKICDITGELPEDLFPEHMRIVLERNVSALELNAAQIAEISDRASPERSLEGAELTQTVAAVVRELTPRQRQVISLRFGLSTRGREMTSREIADLLGVSVTTTLQIEGTALQKLRGPAYANRLRLARDGYLSDDE